MIWMINLLFLFELWDRKVKLICDNNDVLEGSGAYKTMPYRMYVDYVCLCGSFSKQFNDKNTYKQRMLIRTLPRCPENEYHPMVYQIQKSFKSSRNSYLSKCGHTERRSHAGVSAKIYSFSNREPNSVRPIVQLGFVLFCFILFALLKSFGLSADAFVRYSYDVVTFELGLVVFFFRFPLSFSLPCTHSHTSDFCNFVKLLLINNDDDRHTENGWRETVAIFIGVQYISLLVCIWQATGGINACSLHKHLDPDAPMYGHFKAIRSKNVILYRSPNERMNERAADRKGEWKKTTYELLGIPSI